MTDETGNSREDYKEALGLVVSTMESHAGVFDSLSADVASLALQLEGVTAQLESMESQLLRVRKTALEITDVLNDRGEKLLELQAATNTENDTLRATTHLAERLLVGTGSQQAEEGQAHARAAVQASELARQGEEAVGDGIAQAIAFVSRQIVDLVDGVGVQILNAKEKITETATATGVSATNLTTTSAEASTSARELKTYKDTL